MFNFSLKFGTLLMKLDMLCLLFVEIDLTIGFERIEIDCVSFSQVQKMLGWLPRFACQKAVMSEMDLVLSDLRFANRYLCFTGFDALIITVVSVCANST